MLQITDTFLISYIYYIYYDSYLTTLNPIQINGFVSLILLCFIFFINTSVVGIITILLDQLHRYHFVRKSMFGYEF